MDENKKNENGSGGGVWEFVKVVLISLAIVLPIRIYVAQPFIVEGSSMEPNFHNGEYLIIDELSYAFREPKRGEVIVFRYPKMPSEFFIKRIIGLPGETVDIKGGRVFVRPAGAEDATELNESYLPDSLETAPNLHIVLDEKQYFVLGDNRRASSDSRYWGALPEKNIMGRSLLRLWPVARAGFAN